MKKAAIIEGEQPVSTSVEANIAQVLQKAIRHPATWLFIGAWVLGIVTLAITGHSTLIPMRLAIGLGVLLLAAGTLIITTGKDVPAFVQRPISRGRLWLQLGLTVLAIILASTVQSVWAAQLQRIPNDIVNPTLYFIIPLLLLLAAGARIRELHLGPGWRSWYVMALWIIPLLILLLIGVLRHTYGGPLWALVVGNTLQNGFFEEFLWRGALMSRLRLLLDNGWSLVLSSLAFGVWHVQAVLQGVGGNLLAAIAITITTQALIGLGFAIVVYRTRNLLASSVIHVIWDTAFQVLG